MRHQRSNIIGLLIATMFAAPFYAQSNNGSNITITGTSAENSSVSPTVGQTGVASFTGDLRRPRNLDEQFINAASTEFPETALARPTADLDRTIIQGTIIHATMETRLNSDLPGQIRAITSLDTRSFDGSAVLIPKGSRVYGTYRSDGSINQERALIVWTRIVTPDGLSMMIGSPGVDRLGTSGQTGFVDKHFDERFGSAFLISMIGATPDIVATQVNDPNASDIIDEITSDLSDATNDVIAEYLSIVPTIYIDQGTTVNVMVARDIIFPYF